MITQLHGNRSVYRGDNEEFTQHLEHALEQIGTGRILREFANFWKGLRTMLYSVNEEVYLSKWMQISDLA